MPLPHAIAGFALLCFGLAVTPGPNMIHLASRSIGQGPAASLTSLVGTALGFVVYSLCTAFGVTALLFAVPIAYDVLRFCGALYLAYLAWHALKPGARSPFGKSAPAGADSCGSLAYCPGELPMDSSRRLVTLGFMTNLLNPKAALLYLSLLPQFIDTAAGHVLQQSLLLCSIQICISMLVTGTVILIAGSLAAFLSTRPTWGTVQRWLMGSVLAGLAVHMAVQARTR